MCQTEKKIKGEIKKINRENFSNIQERVRETNVLLKAVQVQALSDPTPENFQHEKELEEK